MPAPASNLFEDLKRVLTEFKQFLDQNVGTIRPAVAALRSVVPQVDELLDRLIELLGQLKTEIQNLNPGAVGPALTQVTQFTTSARTLLETARNLLPNEAGTIDEILGILNVVGSLPSLDAVKAEIATLIDAVVGHLQTLRQA